jgi:hypothetical protein
MKFFAAVLLFAVAAHAGPVKRSISGYGLVSPVAYKQGAVVDASAGYALAGAFSGKGASKVQAAVRPARPAVKIGPVSAAVITSRTQEFINVPISEDIVTPQVVIIEPNLTPVTIEFRSRSSPVSIQQVHIPGPKGQVKTTRSEEEADRVIHEVIKPVIQEVREIIQPMRKITQQILPVQEEVLSVVSKGERKQTFEEAIVPAVEIAEDVSANTQQEEQQQQESSPIGTTVDQLGTIVQAGILGGARIMPVEDASSYTNYRSASN